MKLFFYRSLFLSLFFSLSSLSAQTGVRSYSVSSSDSYNGTKYDYSVTVQYRMQDAGYGNSPTALKVGFKNFQVTEVYYNGKRASSYLSTMNFPMSQKLQANLLGRVSVNKGSSSMSYTFQIGWVSDGGMDNYDLTQSDKNRLYSVFDKDITCNDISINMTSAEVSKLNVTFIGSIVDAMKRKEREEANEKIKKEKKVAADKKAADEEEKKVEDSNTEETESSNTNSTKSNSSSSSSSSSGNNSKSTSNSAKKDPYQEKKAQRERDAEVRRERAKAQNAQIAAAGAAQAGILYMLGGVIYDNMGRIPNGDIYTGDNLFLGIDIGFSGTLGNKVITVDLNVNPYFGYEREIGDMFEAGVYINPSLSAGINPLFDTQFTYSYGGRVFAGLKNIKPFFEFQKGVRTFNNSASDNIPAIKSKDHYRDLKFGLKFSFDEMEGLARHHVYLGVISERVGIKETYFLDDTNKPINYTGYMLEWKHDHHAQLFIKYIPDYKLFGFDGEEANTYFNIGYLRSIESFFKK